MHRVYFMVQIATRPANSGQQFIIHKFPETRQLRGQHQRDYGVRRYRPWG
jgi:hypothetical protein